MSSTRLFFRHDFHLDNLKSYSLIVLLLLLDMLVNVEFCLYIYIIENFDNKVEIMNNNKRYILCI